MSSEPDQPVASYEPTNPEALLARAKQRSVTLRRRRLLGAGTSLAVVLALVLAALFVPGGPARHSEITDRIGSAYQLTADESPAAPASPKVMHEVESAEVAFSIDLLGHLTSRASTSNELVSPSSLATALAMLELGAKGSTETGIAAALASAGLSPSDQAAGWYGMAAALAAETSATASDLAKLPELDIANSVWAQDSFTVEQSFLDALSSNFRTGLWRVDFEQNLSGAIAAINHWTSEHTHGLIKRLFSRGALSSYTVLALADAVYFDAHWATAFKPATKDATFHLSSGATESVPFMTSEAPGTRPKKGVPKSLTVPASVTKDYDAVELPYGGKKLSALVLMPRTTSLSSFVAGLTPASLGRILSGLRSQPVVVTMPTFTLRADDHLNGTLSSMGMSQAFGPGADFRGISHKVALQVEAVEQRDYLQVTPKGTVAAAATGVSVEPTSVPVAAPIVIDHPFLFVVRDNATGTILFEATVENPAR